MVQWNGNRLVQGRLRSGMTQDVLARAVGTSVTNISRWERGRNRPGAAMVLTLALTLGIEPESLFQADDESEAEKDDGESDSLTIDEFLARRIDMLLRQRLGRLEESA
jgi:transcriptional regulator with XRE-family HTH domain